MPQDISVIGYSSKAISNHSIPRLTIIRQHAKEIGANAAQLLIKRLQNKSLEADDFSTRIIKTSLIKNESTL